MNHQRALWVLFLLLADCSVGSGNDSPTVSLTVSDPDVSCDISVSSPAGTRVITSPGNSSLILPGYAVNAVVTVTALPHATFMFGYWTGTDVGGNDTANPAKVTLTSDKTVTLTCPAATAMTTASAYPLTINNTESWCAVTASVGGTQVANFSDASAIIQVAPGATVDLTASPVSDALARCSGLVRLRTTQPTLPMWPRRPLGKP